MKNSTIYKGLKFNNYSIELNGVDIVDFPIPDNDMEKFMLEQSIFMIKRNLRSMEKKYISLCVDVEALKVNDYYFKAVMKCEEIGIVDTGRFTKEITFFVDGFKCFIVG